MVKCPNCGSTAQVKENIPHVDKYGNYVYSKYVCGCGLYFDEEEKNYELIDDPLCDAEGGIAYEYCRDCPLFYDCMQEI